LSANGREGIKTYVAQSHTINDYARGLIGESRAAAQIGSNPDIALAQIDGALRGAIVPQDVMVYRGGWWDEAFDVGAVVADDGFLSTSLDIRTAEAFRSGDEWVMEIFVPQGANGAYMGDWFSVFGNEYEMLFARGQRMRVLYVDKEAKRVILEMLT
jgi:hypothetical protein